MDFIIETERKGNKKTLMLPKLVSGENKVMLACLCTTQLSSNYQIYQLGKER